MKAEALQSEFGAIKTFEEVIDAPCCSIGYLAKEKGPEAARDLVALLIAQFVDSVNVGQTLNKTQILILAEDILEEFNKLKISDLILFFKMARRGKFGEFYNILSGEKVFSWLNQYFDQRCNFAESRSIRQSQRHKKDEVLEISHTRNVTKANGYVKQVTDRIVKRL